MSCYDFSSKLFPEKKKRNIIFDIFDTNSFGFGEKQNSCPSSICPRQLIKMPTAAEPQAEEAIKVNKWDGTAVKNALDDGVKEILTKRLSYVEDHSLMDGRLWICGVAVAFATFALVWDFFYPFPLSRYLGLCLSISCYSYYSSKTLILSDQF